MFCLSLALSILISSANAGNAETKAPEFSAEHLLAEHHRLSGEIRSLARRSAWKGVDQTYARISLLEVDMTWEDHLYGAHAASELGQVAETHRRLLAAVHIKPEKVLVDWLWGLDQSYGRVKLSAEAPAVLSADSIPLDPVERKAVERAIESCEQTGSFDGMLPMGHYQFNGEVVKVEAGQRVEHVTLAESRRSRYHRVR